MAHSAKTGQYDTVVVESNLPNSAYEVPFTFTVAPISQAWSADYSVGEASSTDPVEAAPRSYEIPVIAVELATSQHQQIAQLLAGYVAHYGEFTHILQQPGALSLEQAIGHAAAFLFPKQLGFNERLPGQVVAADFARYLTDQGMPPR